MRSERDRVRLAKALITLKEDSGDAQRFLDLGREEARLRRRLPADELELLTFNPLTQIRLAPPLSVAGEPPEVVRLAEAFVWRGVPIATQLDSGGRHRGTPIDKVRTRLYRIGFQADGVRVVRLYAALCRPESWAEQRELSAALGRVRRERQTLARRLERRLNQCCRHRFTVVLLREDLAQALARIPAAAAAEDQVLVIASGAGGLRIGGLRVPILEALKAGAQTVRRADLECALRGARGERVALEFCQRYWTAWSQSARPLAFACPASEPVAPAPSRRRRRGT